MSTRDSGVIDLFAIHKEEEARMSAAPSAPPPAFSLDIGRGAIDDDEIESFAAAQQKSRKRTKLIGTIAGGVAVVGILIAAITTSTSKEPEKATAAAAAPPPPAVTALAPPVAEPPSTPLPAPPATSKVNTEKPDYTPATAAAAYAASQGKKKPSGPAKRSIGAGIKLQKVQSSGVSN